MEEDAVSEIIDEELLSDDGLETMSNNSDDVNIIEDEDIDIDVNVNMKLENIKETELVSHSTTYSAYYSQVKKTKPFLTKYERAKILGVRAQMISNGAIPLVTVPKHVSSTLEIAELELEQKVLPLFIRRRLPNNEVEDWRIKEMII